MYDFVEGLVNSFLLKIKKAVDFTTSEVIMEKRFQKFTVLITKINRNIKRIKTEEMDKYNLKSPHVSCLYYLFLEKEEQNHYNLFFYNDFIL